MAGGQYPDNRRRQPCEPSIPTLDSRPQSSNGATANGGRCKMPPISSNVTASAYRICNSSTEANRGSSYDAAMGNRGENVAKRERIEEALRYDWETSNNKIALRLDVSPHTVGKYRQGMIDVPRIKI